MFKTAPAVIIRDFAARVFPALALLLATVSPAADAHVSQSICQSKMTAGETIPTCFRWSLPCEERIQSVDEHGKPVLKGSVSAQAEKTDFSAVIDGALTGALKKVPGFSEVEKSSVRFAGSRQRAIEGLCDAANYVAPYRGFGPSSEAADIILDEKIRVKNNASAQYARQRLVDELHSRVIQKTLQLAYSLGVHDPATRMQMRAKAMSGLSELCGQQEADAVLEKLSSWESAMRVPDDFYQRGEGWDVDVCQEKLQTVTQCAMQGDPMVRQLIGRVRKYNHRSRLASGSSKVIEGTLGLATWIAPGILIPAARELANTSFIMSTGGPEQNKLMKELYYDKRLESRYRLVNHEAQLALSQYQGALRSKNLALIACCEAVLAQLVGADNAAKILDDQTVLIHRSSTSAQAASNQTAPTVE